MACWNQYPRICTWLIFIWPLRGITGLHLKREFLVVSIVNLKKGSI